MYEDTKIQRSIDIAEGVPVDQAYFDNRAKDLRSAHLRCWLAGFFNKEKTSCVFRDNHALQAG